MTQSPMDPAGSYFNCRFQYASGKTCGSPTRNAFIMKWGNVKYRCPNHKLDFIEVRFLVEEVTVEEGLVFEVMNI